MKDALDRLSPFDKKKKCLNVVVETPKGSRVKYAYDSDIGLFRLKKALPEGMTFPFNFGFIPGTAADDGDPLDILILNEEPLVPGCLLKVTLAGVIKAKQTEDGENVRNDRLFGFALAKETPTSMESIGVSQKTLKEIEYFFKSYNKLEGKKFKLLGQSGKSKALAIVKTAAGRFLEEKSSPSDDD
jgi:inorganic pyrophosphatase